MELRFKGSGELIKLVIDRENKKAQIASSKTHYKLMPIEWKMLFDKGKERIQEKITDKLDDDKFKRIIVASMMQRGYILIQNGTG